MNKRWRNIVDWRDPILDEFTTQITHLTMVADPDGLLLEETLFEAIQDKGFEIIPFEDHVTFRFVYESKFRLRRDKEKGKTADLVVVQRAEKQDLKTLPFDLLQIGRQLSFNLGELFPNLSYPIVASLDRGHLDVLFRAQKQFRPGRLGDDATKDFALLHVFEIAPAHIKHPSELLRVLLRKHYRGQQLPHILDDRLVQVLRQSGTFDSWALEKIIPDREAFFSFLQERWPLFLDYYKGKFRDGMKDVKEASGLKIDGPINLPFDHDDIRVYIDNLFIEGMLSPVSHESSGNFRGEWTMVGIRADPQAEKMRRLRSLMEITSNSIPDHDARHQDWSAFAFRWAELGILWSDMAITVLSELGRMISDLRTEVDGAFLAWLERRYAGLHNQPPDPPVMVHHLPRYLSRWLSDAPQDKVVLIVVDGLALDQWLVLRDTLVKQRPQFRFRESAVFAWVPTITFVSRQAIFAGKLPLYFPSSIRTTDREASLWSQFWAAQGLMPQEVSYGKGLGDGPLNNIRELLSQPGLRALGLVIDKVDRIMHGMELGSAGMHNQVQQWVSEGFIAKFLDALLDEDFSVFLTSDHGNIEAEGCGRPAEGAVADLRGERVRIYPDSMLRSRVKEQFPEAIEWPAIGLPEDYLSLLAPGRSVFVRKGQRIVGHGGLSLEEVIVPMVQIERATV